MKADSASTDTERVVRVFAATPPPPCTITLMQQARQQTGMEAWKWMRPHNLHLTLCFLGPVRAASLASLAEALHKAAEGLGNIRLQSDGLRWMPEKKPRMLWWRFRKHPDYSELHKALHKAAEPFKLRPKAYELQPWPHITLARFKGMRPEKLPPLTETNATDTFIIQSFMIWQSIHEDGQTNYRITEFHYRLRSDAPTGPLDLLGK